ncbi:hypothetical protein ANO14919_030230 [Xylariales sp. No.14919]|nr:hypothetical protein ANO14919_030230 [Xylariales sp. No.14919]
MLAIQDSSIKEVDDYIPLNEVTRAVGSDSNRRQIRDRASEETREDRLVAPRKRKAESLDRPARSSNLNPTEEAVALLTQLPPPLPRLDLGNTAEESTQPITWNDSQPAIHI